MTKPRSYSESSIRDSHSKTTPFRASLQLQCALRSQTRTPPQMPVISPLPQKKKDNVGNKSASNNGKETETGKHPGKSLKSKCPCNVSSNGKSWLLTCNSCGQVWHNRCANLKGTS